MKWAHTRTLGKGFQTTAGQLELISDIRAFIPWADSTIFPGSTPAAAPRESLVRQLVAFWVGQHELIARILWQRKRAHARILHQVLQAAVGQFKFIGNTHALNPWANLIAFPGSTPAAGPCKSLGHKCADIAGELKLAHGSLKSLMQNPRMGPLPAS